MPLGFPGVGIADCRGLPGVDMNWREKVFNNNNIFNDIFNNPSGHGDM